jgi:MYXO-CTERM domain-containing protein
MFRRAAWVLVSVIVAWSGTANAFCRQHSCQDEFDELGNALYECERDDMRCIIEGDELFYDSPCLSFGIAKGTAAELDLTDDELHDIVAQAFQRWQEVDCGGGKHPRFEVQSAGIVETSKPHYCELTALNLGVWFLDNPWPEKLDRSALGYTTSTYAEDDAEVFDADVEINVAKIKQDFRGAPVEDVLLSIITHEAGHYLGLAHSNDVEAVMATTYTRLDLIGRELTQDDIDGICSIYPPDSEKLECSEPGISNAALNQKACNAAIDDLKDDQQQSCAYAPTSSASTSHWLGVPALLGLGLWRRRMRPGTGRLARLTH